MNLLAAAATTPAQPSPAYNPAYQNQAYQSTTTQQATPPPRTIKIGYIQLAFTTFYLAVIIFFCVMIYKFVKAFSKIADKGIIIKKDDTTTT